MSETVQIDAMELALLRAHSRCFLLYGGLAALHGLVRDKQAEIAAAESAVRELSEPQPTSGNNTDKLG